MYISDFFRKLSAGLSWLFGKIQDPLSIFGKRWPEKPLPGPPQLCELCHPNGDPNEWGIPDDIRDMKLKRDNYKYDIKLANLPPEKWKMVGRNLLNMAYSDPQFGKQFDDDTDDEDELPPPPEPSAEIKAMKTPLISVNVDGINVVHLQDMGNMFYEIADMVGKSPDHSDLGNEPTCAVLAREQEAIEDAFFNPREKLAREMIKNIKLTNSDVLPGLPPQRWKSDAEEWFDFMEEKFRNPKKRVEEDVFKNWPGLPVEPPSWKDCGGEDTGLVYNDIRGNNEVDSDIGDVGVPG